MGAPRLGSVALVIGALIAFSVMILRPDGSAATAGVVPIELSEWAISAPASIPAGRVTFETRNTGRLDHELLVLRTDRPADALPMGLEGPSLTVASKLVLGKAHGHDPHELGGLRRNPRHVLPGDARRETVVLAPGKYVLLCSLTGHYAAGQRAPLVVR